MKKMLIFTVGLTLFGISVANSGNNVFAAKSTSNTLQVKENNKSQSKSFFEMKNGFYPRNAGPTGDGTGGTTCPGFGDPGTPIRSGWPYI